MTANPLFGKTLLLTPCANVKDENSVAYDDTLKFEAALVDYEIGCSITNKDSNPDGVPGECEAIDRLMCKQVSYLETIPKTDIVFTYTIGRDLVPVVRGCSGGRGYLWCCADQQIQIGEYLIQIFGLKSLLCQVYPELLPKFRYEPVMKYIDDKILVADISMTSQLIREQQQKDLLNGFCGDSF